MAEPRCGGSEEIRWLDDPPNPQSEVSAPCPGCPDCRPLMPHATSPGGDSYALGIDRRRVANGGWEWFLTVGGRRVGRGEHGVGIFTGPEVRPEEMLPRLLVYYGANRDIETRAVP